MKKLLFIPLAASLALFSCKKEQQDQVKNIDGVVSQQQDNDYRVQNGNLTATISGKISEYSSKYAEASYNFENKSFSFVNNNLVDPEDMYRNFKTNAAYGFVNQTEERLVLWTDEDDKDQEYVVKEFILAMYENSGFNYNDAASDNFVIINFTIFSGTITPDMEDSGIETDVPVEISLGYYLDYSPESSIDYISIQEEISYFYEDGELEENASISGFEFDEATGKIKFSFSGDDSENDRDPKISGTVETEIFFNTIQSVQDNTNQVTLN